MAKKITKIIVTILMFALVATLAACTLSTPSDNPFINNENPGAIGNFTKDQAIDITTSSINNLKKHLDSDTVTETGYFVQFDMDFDADDGTHFTLRFKANLFTHPYYQTDKDGNILYGPDKKPLIDEEKLKIHNEVIKKNDLIIEWFDGHTNRLLLGLYFDGKNSSLANPGNNLYLNLRGETRRMFKNFGDTVAYQQLVRLITSIDINKLLADNDTSVEQGTNILGDYLRIAITNNYKVTKNGDTTSTFYDAVNFDTIRTDITDAIQGIFGPFGNKIDPLTNYYLGFKFSTIGTSQIRSLTSDLRFLSEPQQYSTEQVLCGLELKANGTALVKDTIVPFRTDAAFSYSSRVQSNIKVGEYIDITEYKEYLYGQYEYQGELYVPMMEQNGMDSRMDAVVRTKLTDNVDKNDENRIQMSFTDKANGSRLLLGAYYCNERTYLNTTGLQNLYGGIKLSEIGFPKAYIDGPNIAQLLTDFYQMINDVITDYVDGVISGTGSSVLFNAILSKMTSGEETISIRVDLELIKVILHETQEGNPNYTTQDIIDMLSQAMGYNLEEIAFMLGITDAKRMLEKTWFDLTYNVVTSSIRIELSSNATNESVNSLIFRLDLNPIKIGEKVTFPEGFDGWFDGYTLLKEVKTISAHVRGDIKFSNAAAVDISDLLGAMIGDISGINTRYFLPASSSLSFNLVFDQYVKFDNYEGDVYPGTGWEGQIGEMRGRIGFKLQVWENLSNGGKKPLLNAYAKDVAFNTDCEVAKLGYIWVDIQATGFTKVKIREDVFMAAFTDYMGGNSAAGEAMALSIPQIIGALLSDANSLSFLPDVIELSTSNKTIQKLFGVKAVLLSAKVDIGMTPRVTGITQLEGEFADYTVGNLVDMNTDANYSKGVYEKNLYETIAVTFARGGKTWVENLRVPYYRVPAPGDPKDYETQADYDAALLKYNDYLKSVHSLEVVDGKTLYNPATNGNFMGAFRTYIVEIRKTGGSSLTSVTAKVLGLVSNDLVWEPLEAEPNRIYCNIRTGSLEVPSKFSLDFSLITIDGKEKALYTVTVGPQSIGEVTFQVYITVRNRRIMQENGTQSALATVITEKNGIEKASVAAELSIDPYDYIIWRGTYTQSYGEPLNPIGMYLQSRQDKKTVTFYFGDGLTERVALLWSFDAGSGGLNLERFINEVGGNALYAHAYFHNQLVSLKIKIQQKALDYVKFDGETEKNTYTIDVLKTSSKTIDGYPTFYFKDGTGLRFPFKMDWAFPVANNVTLAGAGLINGKLSPFAGHEGSEDFCWLNIGKQYNGVGSWFNDVLVRINVLAPAKNIANTYQVTDPIKNSAGAVASGAHFAKNIMLDGGVLRGYWFVDTLKAGSNMVPAALTAYFDDATQKHYGADIISWDTSTGLLVREGSKYRFIMPATNEVKTYLINGQISQEFPFELMVVVLPTFDAQNDNLVFFKADGTAFDQAAIAKDPSIISGNTYLYTLDPFVSLFLPTRFQIQTNIQNRKVVLTEVTSGGAIGATRDYYLDYTVKPTRYEGAEHRYQYIMQAGSKTVVTYLQLSPNVQKSEITQITLANGTNLLSAGTNLATHGTYTFATFTLNAQGEVLLSGVETHLKLADYLKAQFTNINIMVRGANKLVTPTMLEFEKFDVQDTLSASGTVLTVAFSEISGLMDLLITVKATGVNTISSQRDFADILQPFTADGQENYKNGYSLASKEFSITYTGAAAIAFKSNWWTVAQVVNLVPTDDLREGSQVSSITRNVILGERVNPSANIEINLFAFLPDSSKVKLSLQITPLEVTAFVSAPNEKFPITLRRNEISNRNYSVVIINNMYAVQEYLTSGDILVLALPRTVRIGSTQIDNVVWENDALLSQNLAALQYKNPENNGATEFKLASSKVSIGQGILLELYIRFLPSILSSVVPENVLSTAGVSFQDLNNRTITVRLSPYDTVGTQYLMPRNFKAKFGGTEAYSFPFKLKYAEKAFLDDSIPYDYRGNTYPTQGLQAGDSRGKMTFALDVGFGQRIVVNILFADQTVGVLSGTADVSDIAFGSVGVGGVYDINTIDPNRRPSDFVLDPYGKKYIMPNAANALMFIPNFVKINASLQGDGDSYRQVNRAVSWSVYQTPFGGAAKQKLVGKLSREGFNDQQIVIYYSVLNRTVAQEGISFADYTSADGNVVVSTSAGVPQMHIKNPFIFRYQTDMPKVAKKVIYMVGADQSAADLPLYWEITDRDIDYNGNNMTVKTIKYRLYDEHGQQFTFSLRLDKWEYVSLERQVNGTWQEMSPIYFLISSVSGESDLTSFRIQFKVTDALGQGFSNRTQIFISETSAAAVGSLAPMLFFDKAAIDLAKTNGQDVQGVFFLGAGGKGNQEKLKYEIARSVATTWYSAAAPSIVENYFEYSVLSTTYNSPYVLIDPLNPVWPTKMVAKVNWTTALVTMDILPDGNPFAIDMIPHLNRGGGVIIGRTVYVSTPQIKTPFKHKINILILDRTSKNNIVINAGALPPVAITLVSKDLYSKTTYQGTYNPYSDSYSAVINLLNQATLIYGNSQEISNIVWDTLNKKSISFQYKGIIFGTAAAPCSLLSYTVQA